MSRLLGFTRQRIPSRLQSYIDPQDVVQDTLFAATLSIGGATFDAPDAVWRWLAGVAQHVVSRHVEAQDTLKRGGHTRRLGEAELRHGSVIVLLQDLAVHERTPSKSAARREFLTTLERLMSQLQPSYRDAVKLRYVQGLSLKEAAARLNRTEESTRKLCVRALEVLRSELRSLSLYS
jgi:RNA polymerase sigma-70 factor (ECF subfamily)